MKTKNEIGVPVKQWRKWSETARAVFNRVNRFVNQNQRAMSHPKQPVMPYKHWSTIAWNAGWIAADAVDNTIPDEVRDV